MKLPDWKKLLSKMSPKKRIPYKTVGEKANHDWQMMLIGFICLCCIIIGGGLYMFIGVSQGSLFLVAQVPTEAVQGMSQSDLNSTIQFFENRKAHLVDLKTNRPNVTDPSL